MNLPSARSTSEMTFFVGLHHPHVAGNFDHAFISVNVIRNRKSAFPANEWIMDSGAFTTIFKHGGYPLPVSEYAAQIRRWKDNGKMLAAVSQDLMCEREMLIKVAIADGVLKPPTAAELGFDEREYEVVVKDVDITPDFISERIKVHQQRTIERYDALLAEDTGAYIMPVLQGYSPGEYRSHIRQYGERLKAGMWVGVGSVCKRNTNIMSIWMVLEAIHDERPDLLLHGFGLKKTSLQEPMIRDHLHTADSMAWSFAARKEGRNANDWREAKIFENVIRAFKDAPQLRLFKAPATWWRFA